MLGKTYSMEFVRDTGKVPLCEACKTPVRPNVCLFGEMVDNRIMTRAAEEVQRADVLLVLVNAVPHFSDRLADISINDRVDNTLEKILKELGD